MTEKLQNLPAFVVNCANFNPLNSHLCLPWLYHLADCIVSQVLKPFLVKNGKKWDGKKAHKLVGKTPYEAAAVVLEDYGLPYSTEEFLSMITPMFSEQ